MLDGRYGILRREQEKEKKGRGRLGGEGDDGFTTLLC